ncbi:Protein of unknown function [Oceanospirillum multiglobuliferum]|uniref:DUF2889 domain-containing protein n=1 Tax=Oceanospirillum multiglobuliferum TaxID=64969 RepID=A0A1T4RWU2_9GAMM|nr:DUF2889 domain-containing protein [Oceanospirillum multiglobuliferum]OPX54579.1 hypothetical protein BTE48_13430 [Oceanospirillum multiglobuliferum]SKA20415.1 Protein of unknown function [Oceanospirillum multiglobuliferum]
MPLSDGQTRQLVHTRTVTCRAYARNDGLWDIEGHMTDIKTKAIDNEDRGGVIAAGEPVHEMWLRISIDVDLLIHDAEACTDYAPFNICADITPAYKKLIGLKIGAGWNKEIKARLGNQYGCTHHTELLGPMATTAYQALYSELKKKEEASGSKPAIMNTCHSLAEHSSVAKRLWPDFATTESKS